MKRAVLLFAAVPVAFALAACDAPTSPRQSFRTAPSRDVIVNDHVESAVFALSDCNGDFLSGTGTIHTVIGVTPDGSGGFHVTYKQQFSNVKATGFPSGASYVGSQEYSDNLNFTAGVEQTVNLSAKLIGQGQTPNEVLHFLFHITVNANGDVTSFVDNFSVECH